MGGAETVVLGSLSTQIRSCIATCGSGGGAAARRDAWRYLFGFITVWLGESMLMMTHHDYSPVVIIGVIGVQCSGPCLHLHSDMWSMRRGCSHGGSLVVPLLLISVWLCE